MYGGQHSISPTTTVSASANQAQLAAAVTDADAPSPGDLAGIYFAVQASYEKQLVTANQQALNAAVQPVPRRLRQGAEKAPGAAADGQGPAIPPGQAICGVPAQPRSLLKETSPACLPSPARCSSV